MFGLAYGGAYAEYVKVSDRMVIKKPEGMSWEQAAGVPETWITATQALWTIGQFAPGKRVSDPRVRSTKGWFLTGG